MKHLLRLGFCVALFVLLLNSVDGAALWRVFSGVDTARLSYLAGITVALIYCSVLKWRLFLDELENCPTVVELFRLYVIGYFVNSFLPSSLGGDVLRSWQVGRRTGQAEAFVATFLERYTGFVAMLFLGVCLMWFSPLVSWSVCSMLLAVAAATICISLFAFSPAAMGLLSRLRLPTKITKTIGKLHSALQLAIRKPKLVGKAMALSFTFHSLTIVNTLAACWIVGWYDAPVLEFFVVVPLILLIGALPLTPSGLGVQEGAFYFFLAGLGASPEQALGVGLVLRAKTIVLGLIGGLLWLKVKGIPGQPLQQTEVEL